MLKQFRLIAATSGNKSTDKKKAMITKLLAASKAQEAGYIMRALQVGPRTWGTGHTLCLTLAFPPYLLYARNTARRSHWGRKDARASFARGPQQ